MIKLMVYLPLMSKLIFGKFQAEYQIRNDLLFINETGCQILWIP